MTLNVPDLRRRAGVIGWIGPAVTPDELRSLLDLAQRLKVSLESAEPFINNQSRFADVVRAALAAAKEAGL